MDQNFIPFASPWWVNLLILIPFICYYFWRNKLDISLKTLLAAGLFAAAFGFVEAACVVYLRGAAGLLQNISAVKDIYQQANILALLPEKLLRIEVAREAATMIMLIAIAFLAVKTKRERWAVYFWVFAFWDIFYYVGLFATIGWPSSLTTPDVLFLIPIPWYSQVWFPFLVSGLFILSIILGRKRIKMLLN